MSPAQVIEIYNLLQSIHSVYAFNFKKGCDLADPSIRFSFQRISSPTHVFDNIHTNSKKLKKRNYRKKV